MSGNMSRSWRLYCGSWGLYSESLWLYFGITGVDAREAYAPKMSKIQAVRWEDGQAAT